jgi:ubiquinone/menaquinone biosynthesis C-methylase UbiE
MGFYKQHIVPCLTQLSMRQRRLKPYRRRVVAVAGGRVLEIGIGSGLNLPFYGQGTIQVIGLDTSSKLLEVARDRRRKISTPLKLVEASAEDIPVEDHSIDTVVTTWTLSSTPDAPRALAEMRRVLKAGGRLLFGEHGRAPEPRVQWWQDHLTPAWKHFSGGCHLNRAIGDLIQNAGFHIERLDAGYVPGPKMMTFMYEGSARPA